MQPTFHPTLNPGHKRRFPLALLGIIPVVILGAVVYHAMTFHIVKTDPSLSKVGDYTPYIRLYFNKPLSDKSLKITDTQGIVAYTSVNDKTATLTFKPHTLTIGKHYTITIEHIASTSGDAIDHKVLNFDAKNIPVSSFSSEQQQTIVGNQDHYPYSVHSILFNDFDELTNNGLTSDQVQVVKQAIFDYSQKVTIKFAKVELDTSSINPGPFDPNSDTAARTLTFNITADNNPYSILVSYSDLSSAAVQIHDQSGAVVFDNTQDSNYDINSVAE